MADVNISKLVFSKYNGGSLPAYFKWESEEQDLADFYNEDALNLQIEKLTAVINVYYEEKMAAYFAYTVSEIRRGEILPKHKLAPFPHPCLKLGRLLVCSSMRERGIGKAIVYEFARRALQLSEIVPIRFITVDSKPNAVKFYEQLGFFNAGLANRKHPFLYIDLTRILI